MNELIVLAGLAFADAINPTTLGICLYLLLHHNYIHKVLVFSFGVLVTYFTFGLVLEIGFDRYLLNLWGEQHPAFIAINIFIGAAIVIYGFLLGRKPRKSRASLQQKSVVSLHSAFVLGCLATIVDLPTAFPYLGAISIIGALSSNFTEAMMILWAYNLIVILPLLGLLLIRIGLGDRSEAVIKKVRTAIFRWERPVLRATLIIIGFFFLLNALKSLV